MAKAPVEDQFRLLELQQLDNVLDVAKRTFEQTLKHPDLAAAREKLSEAKTVLDAARAKVAEEAQAEKDLEHEIETIQARINKDQTALDQCNGSASTLTNLQQEIETLRAKKADLERGELEIMDSSEKHHEELKKAEKHFADAEKDLKLTEDNLRITLSEVQERGRHAQEERKRLADTIDSGLLTIYDKIRARNMGLGAARLFQGVSEGSNVRLPPGDLAEIAKAAPDDVVLCPDSGVILVRSEDWE